MLIYHSRVSLPLLYIPVHLIRARAFPPLLLLPLRGHHALHGRLECLLALLGRVGEPGSLYSHWGGQVCECVGVGGRLLERLVLGLVLLAAGLELGDGVQVGALHRGEVLLVVDFGAV